MVWTLKQISICTKYKYVLYVHMYIHNCGYIQCVLPKVYTYCYAQLVEDGYGYALGKKIAGGGILYMFGTQIATTERTDI